MDALSSSNFEPSTPTHWAARLNLNFDFSAGKTRVSHVEHRGPLRIQRPFYPETAGTAHVYLLHPPGGVAGGDRLHIQVEAESQSHALLTAPAANKLYRSRENSSVVQTRIYGRESSIVEWLPQETIAFSGARADLSTLVQLEEGAAFFGWEICCLGRPAAHERFEQGYVHQSFELWREETPLYVDRVRMDSSGETVHAKWGLSGQCVMGTAVIAGEKESLGPLVREVLKVCAVAGRVAVTDLRGGVTIIRYVGPQVAECWKVFVRVWETVRPVLLGRPAVHPRIWSY